MASTIAFYVISIAVVLAAWRVVVSPDAARATFALVIVLAGLAPLFVLLAAEFVAVIQLLVYVGAVVVVLLFALMLTKRGQTATRMNLSWPYKVAGGVVSFAIFGLLSFSFAASEFGGQQVAPQQIGRTADVGIPLLRNYIVAFELVSILLLVTLIGAIVIARRGD